MKAKHSTEIDILAGRNRFHQKTYLRLWNHADLQLSLQTGRETFSHALCLCRKEPLKLQIRLRDSRFHLAVWPGESEKHDSECIFFRDELTHHKPIVLPGSDSQPAETTQFRPKNGTTGPRWALQMAYQVDAQESQQQTRAHRLEVINGRSEAVPGQPIISVKKLLMFLWEKSKLSRWHPSWTRDWGRVRWQLEKLSSDISINGTPLTELLFVPRPYRESAKESLNIEWDQFVRSLPVPGQRKTPPRIIISAVRRYSPAVKDRPAVVHLRHLRHPIGLSDSCDSYLQRDCKASLKQITPTPIDRASGVSGQIDSRMQPEVIGCFLVDGTSRGGVFARAAWMMNVHPSLFILANNPTTVLLVDELASNGYMFDRILSDEPPMSRTFPEWIIRHAMDPAGVIVSRIALEILDRGVSADFLAARRRLSDELKSMGIPTWTWTPSGPWHDRTVPALPPHENLDSALAKIQLQSILIHADVKYQYGTNADSLKSS